MQSTCGFSIAAHMRFVSSPRDASKPEWIDAITQSSPASSSSSMFTVPSRRMSTSTPRSTWMPFTSSAAISSA